MEVTERDIGYLCGIIDGDGSIYETKNRTYLEIYNSNLDIMAKSAEILLRMGISYGFRQHKPKSGHLGQKPMYRIRINNPYQLLDIFDDTLIKKHALLRKIQLKRQKGSVFMLDTQKEVERVIGEKRIFSLTEKEVVLKKVKIKNENDT